MRVTSKVHDVTESIKVQRRPKGCTRIQPSNARQSGHFLQKPLTACLVHLTAGKNSRLHMRRSFLPLRLLLLLVKTLRVLLVLILLPALTNQLTLIKPTTTKNLVGLPLLLVLLMIFMAQKRPPLTFVQLYVDTMRQLFQHHFCSNF